MESEINVCYLCPTADMEMLNATLQEYFPVWGNLSSGFGVKPFIFMAMFEKIQMKRGRMLPSRHTEYRLDRGSQCDQKRQRTFSVSEY